MKISYRSFIMGILIISSAGSGIVFSSIIMYRITALMLFVFCILRGTQEKKIINPFFLFSITPLSLVIYENISVRYMVDLDKNTWFIAIINIAAFVCALNDNGKRNVSQEFSISIGTMEKQTILLAVVGVLPSIYKLFLGRTMPVSSILILFLPVAMAMAIQMKNTHAIILLGIVYAFSIFLNFSKASLLTSFMLILVSIEKYWIVNKKRRFVFIMVCLLALCILILSFSFAVKGREATSAIDALLYYTKYGGVSWNYNERLFMPYMYLTTPWTNLQYLMETQNTRTYGLWSIKPLLSYLQIDNYFSKYYGMHAYSGFNTFTFIGCHFKDFGVLFSVLPSAFLGLFVRKVYRQVEYSDLPMDTACYAMVSVAVLEMFFSNEFFTQSFPFTIVILVYFYKYYLKKTGLLLRSEKKE